MECLGRLSWMPWESSGISEIARTTNVRFTDSWTDDPSGRSVRWICLLYILSTTIRSDGDYPSEGIPLRLFPTIRFGIAIDAINVSESTYLPSVRYYLANLGTTMESQVRSSVFSPKSPILHLPPVDVGCHPGLQQSIHFSSFPPRFAVCRAFLQSFQNSSLRRKRFSRTQSLPALAGPYLGRDIRSNFLLKSRTTEHVGKTRAEYERQTSGRRTPS